MPAYPFVQHVNTGRCTESLGERRENHQTQVEWPQNQDKLCWLINWITHTRIHCTVERYSNQAMLQICYCFCGPVLTTIICSLTKNHHERRTVQAKIAFERYTQERGVQIQHYHAVNGTFANKGFINNCQLNNQHLTYCGVNAHFQNGIAEKRIWDLQEATRTSLLYALHKWPRMLSVHLWPYAMCTGNEIMISMPTKYSDKSPQELFSSVNILPKIKHFHTFTCPTYVLDTALQGQHYLPKWKERARLGVYLGSSPNHSRTVHLILNPRTGPQYHVKHDDFFESVTGKSSNFDSPEPTWKRLSGLVE